MKKAVLAVAFLMLAAVAGAHDHGSNGMGGPGNGPGGPEGGLTVGSDGTVYVTSEATSNGTTTASVTAISPAGTTLWTATLPGRGRLVLSDGNLIQVTKTEATSTTAASSTLTAISTVTGKTAWTLTANGIVGELHPFSGGTYAVVVTPAATSGANATRTLEAISNSGAVLWSVPLS